MSPAITPTRRCACASCPARPCQYAAGARGVDRRRALARAASRSCRSARRRCRRSRARCVPVVLTCTVVPSSTSVARPLSSVVMPVRATNARSRSSRVPGSTVPFTGEPRELALVRRDHAAFAAQHVQMLREMEERARVGHERQLEPFDEAAHDRPYCRRSARARARGRRSCNGCEIAQVPDRARRTSRSGHVITTCSTRCARSVEAASLGRRDRHVTGARPRRAARAQHRRAGKLRRAGDDQRCAGAALLRSRSALGKQLEEFALVERFVCRRPEPVELAARGRSHRDRGRRRNRVPGRRASRTSARRASPSRVRARREPRRCRELRRRRSADRSRAPAGRKR